MSYEIFKGPAGVSPAPQEFKVISTDAIADLSTGTYFATEGAQGIFNQNDIIWATCSDGNIAGTVTKAGIFTAGLGDYGVGGSGPTITGSTVTGAIYNNAGGSATVTITGATGVTGTSVVQANITTSANAVNVQKVTPGTGVITVLLSGDPGVSTLSWMLMGEAL